MKKNFGEGLRVFGLTCLLSGCAHIPEASKGTPAERHAAVTGAKIGDKVAGALYGAKKANAANSAGPIRDIVEGELGIASDGLEPPSLEARAEADARVSAGLAGNHDAYKSLALKASAELEKLRAEKKQADESRTIERAAAEAELETKKLELDATEKTLVKTRFAAVAGTVSAAGAAALAVGVWLAQRRLIFGGAALIGCGALMGGVAFIYGTPFFYGLLGLALLGLTYGAWYFLRGLHEAKTEVCQLREGYAAVGRAFAQMQNQADVIAQVDPHTNHLPEVQGIIRKARIGATIP